MGIGLGVLNDIRLLYYRGDNKFEDSFGHEDCLSSIQISTTGILNFKKDLSIDDTCATKNISKSRNGKSIG